MRFDKQELIDILHALEMQYIDGPVDYDHAIRLQRLINVIKSFLETI